MNKEKERSRFNAMLNLKCPNCRKGNLFKPVNKLSDLFEMEKCCSECQQPYEIEIGFYWGAMYVAYALSSAVCMSSTLIFMFVFGMNMIPAFCAMVFLIAILAPYIFRLARSIWLHAFVNKGEHVSKKQ